MIEKGFCLYLYDFKYDDLSRITYNHLLKHYSAYSKPPRFYVLNFDCSAKSHRANPIKASLMTDIADAFESAHTILVGLNKTWAEKSGDFFIESPIVLLSAVIWFLRIYKDGKYCTFPHVLEFLNKPYEDIFLILASHKELQNYMSPFRDALAGQASEQLQGQLASCKIPLSRLISPELYWVMSGDDFDLTLNDPESPKILCVANNPERQVIYSAALSLYNARIVKLINKKGRLKSGVIVDELSTIYFRGLDQLLATARSNKVAVCVGFQDFSQLERDYGTKESKVIVNIIGNLFAGQCSGETARNLSERFGKIVQLRSSVTVNPDNKSSTTNTQLDSLIPQSTINTLSQGTFVGLVTDNIDEPVDQKIFHCKIVVDNEQVKKETEAYVPIPEISDFRDADGNDCMKRIIEENYDRIRAETDQIVIDELARINSDPALLKKLLGKKAPKEE